MAQICTICALPKESRDIIDKGLIERYNYALLAKEFQYLVPDKQLNGGILNRHHQTCLGGVSVQRQIMVEKRQLVELAQPGLFTEQEKDEIVMVPIEDFDPHSSYIMTFILNDWIVARVKQVEELFKIGTKEWGSAIALLLKANEMRGQALHTYLTSALAVGNDKVQDRQYELIMRTAPPVVTPDAN